VDEGDSVEAGMELASIAPPPEDSRSTTALKAQLASAEARREEAKAVLAEAESNLVMALGDAQRRAELFDRGLISIEERDHVRETADAAKARVESAKASLNAADANVEGARARLMGVDSASLDSELTAVRSPVGGTVLRVFEESERVVPAGTPLFEIGQGNTLEIVIDFLTQDAVKIDPGDVIKIDGWGGNETLFGTVRYVEPRAFTKISTLGVEEQRVNVIGDIPDPPASLGAEFRVEAAIVVWSGDSVLRIPTTAIFRRLC
jgi:HlyD family secretion protein